MDLKRLLFPFDKPRRIQKDFLLLVNRVIEEKKHAIAHVPTGIGKTAAALSPALKHAIENDLKVFFLTPKHTQHKIVIETLELIKRRYKINFQATDIIGKRWMCPIEGAALLSSKDFADYCKTLKEEERCIYYKNIISEDIDMRVKLLSLVEKIKEVSPLHVEEVCEICKKAGFCPYEISTYLAKDSVVIVADYFHVFSPPVQEIFLRRVDAHLEEIILIIDEAHNLPSRVRELLSEKLTITKIERAIKEAEKFEYPGIAEDLKALNDIVKEVGFKYREEAFIAKEEINEKLEERGISIDAFIEDLELCAKDVRTKRKISYCGSIARFLKAWENEGKEYARILKRKDNSIEIKYLCLDPAVITQDIINSCWSVIAMSGTLTPCDMYRDLLGFDAERTIIKQYPSPFPKENRLNIIVPSVTTRYSKRNELEYKRIGNIVINIIKVTPGRVAVYFPSYELLQKISKYIGNIDRQIFVEKKGASKEERTRLLKVFLSTEKAILLAVQGASFAEGVDFPNNALSCVIIVGLPLEKPDLETQALIDYYDYKFGKGWSYGYIYPAVSKSLQAAGRCIRSENDVGVIVFMDERFTWRNYIKAFPPDLEFKVSENPIELIKKFWKEKNLL